MSGIPFTVTQCMNNHLNLWLDISYCLSYLIQVMTCTTSHNLYQVTDYKYIYTSSWNYVDQKVYTYVNLSAHKVWLYGHP